jgi:hypothetical protein
MATAPADQSTALRRHYRWGYYVSICALLWAGMADILTTLVGLSTGLPEANPVAALLFHTVAPAHAMLALKLVFVTVLVLLVMRLPLRYRPWPMWALAAVWGLVSLYNLTVILTV